MANYGYLKTMRAAAIGTILPWTGDLTRVPPGWIICSGDNVLAKDYPLLAQAIGDYYGGSSSFNITNFPWNTSSTESQEFSLPDLNQKPLADLDSAYFGGGAPNSEIDTAEASTAVASFIGSDQDNGTADRTSDAYADILFSYTAENDFSGTITGNTLDPGFGSRTVYTGARKLGRNHTPIHAHETSFPTIYGQGLNQPGSGVACSREITYNINQASFDEILDGTQIDGRITIPIQNFSGGAPNRLINGNAFGNGTDGVVLGNIASEQPGPNLKAQSAISHGISNWIGITDSFPAPHPEGGNVSSGTNRHNRKFDPQVLDGDPNHNGEMPYAIGGGTIEVPNRNWDPGDGNAGSGLSGDSHLPYKVFFNHSGIDFAKINNTAGRTDIIQSHDHASFQVNLDRDSSSLRMPGQLTFSDVTSNVVPDNLPQALNITVTVPTPKVVILYIIRAY
jgi:hypothetical protein